MQRRTFLSLGIAGAAAFAIGGWWVASRNGATVAANEASTRGIVGAIVPAVLAGALPQSPDERTSAIDETVRGVERAIAGLPPHARAELAQLFSLLAMPAVRMTIAGLLPPWEAASVDDIDAFLERWRTSGWTLKRSAYDAFHQLILAAWYGSPRAWSAIRYPGPPRLSA
jgi:hypothetical protein